jgi:dienelactone hydrolase
MLTHPIRRTLYGGAAGLMLTGFSVAGATAAGASTDAPSAQVKGAMAGNGKYALFFASNKASKRYVPSRIP